MVKIKNILEFVLGNELIFNLFMRVRLYFSPMAVYIVNYHNTYGKNNQNFKRQIEFYLKHFDVIKFEDLETRLGAEAPPKKPALIFTFDDGSASNFNNAAGLLDQFNLLGLFLIPSNFVDAQSEPTIESEVERAKRHSIYCALEEEIADGRTRVSMNWNNIRELKKRGHSIGVHGKNHLRLSNNLSADALMEEIVESKLAIEQAIGESCNTFCWIGGERDAYCAEAARIISETGYEFGLMTCCGVVTNQTNRLQLHRFNIESHFSVRQIRLVLGGFYEMLYWSKRAYVNKISRV